MSYSTGFVSKVPCTSKGTARFACRRYRLPNPHPFFCTWHSVHLQRPSHCQHHWQLEWCPCCRRGRCCPRTTCPLLVWSVRGCTRPRLFATWARLSAIVGCFYITIFGLQILAAPAWNLLIARARLISPHRSPLILTPLEPSGPTRQEITSVALSRKQPVAKEDPCSLGELPAAKVKA
jgi:hypothetical protein